MKLPNAQNAFIDDRKLTEYVLDLESPKGRHKARMFRTALGITAEHASELKSLLLYAVLNAECVEGEKDQYGQRYTVDCTIALESHWAVVRTGWIILKGEDFPRLTTCFPVKKRPGGEYER